jgi:VWFA-related protein
MDDATDGRCDDAMPVPQWSRGARAVRASSALGLCLVGLAPMLAASQPPQAAQPPTFRSGVDVVLVDAVVIDEAGLPIRDLSAGSFDVRVDGKPRRIVSAELLEHTRPPAGSEPGDADFSTNAGRAVGRAVIIVVDVASFRRGEIHAAVLAAGRFLDTLSPLDRVALTTVPDPGPALAFTSDRERVRRLLTTLVGRKDDRALMHKVSEFEAIEIARGRTHVFDEVMARECAGTTGLDLESCSRQLDVEVRALAREAEDSADLLGRGVLACLDRLRAFRGAKTVVVLSQGVVFDMLPFPAASLAAAASLADARVHAIYVEPSQLDLTDRGRPAGVRMDQRLARDGLGTLAGMLGGSIHYAAGAIDATFERMWREGEAVWRIAVEPAVNDLDGKPHRLEVKVNRQRAAVRARSHFIVDRRGRAETPEDTLRSAILSPLPETTLPLRLAHYGLRDPETGEVRLRFFAELGDETTVLETAQVMFVAYNERGEPVAAGKGDVVRPAGAGAGALRYDGALTVEPGRYTIEVGAIDPTGRMGTVERTLDLETLPGRPAVSDLVLALVPPDPDVPVTPQIVLNVTDGRFLEVYHPETGPRAEPDVTFEVADDSRSVVARVPAEIAQGPTSRTTTAQAMVLTRNLDPGRYFARAVAVARSGRLETPWRTVVVQPAETPSDADALPAGPMTGTAGRATTSRLPPIVPAFDRRSVLGGAVLERALAALAARSAAASEPVRTAIAEARAGRFPGEAEEAALRVADPAAGALLRGLGLYAEGELNAAAMRFKDALRDSPDLSPALVYIGACFAASGQDREAATVWQTALNGEGDEPTVYGMLARAFLRQHQSDLAAGIVDEALEEWPGEPELRRLRAIAAAMAGETPEALDEIDALLAARPGDIETACVGFRLITDPPAAPDPSDARAERYASACAEGHEPASAMAARWLRARAGGPSR